LQIFVNKKRKEDDAGRDPDLEAIIELDNLALQEMSPDSCEGNIERFLKNPHILVNRRK
jgi:hypothetical protein